MLRISLYWYVWVDDGYMKVPFFKQYSLKFYFKLSVIPNALIHLSFFSSIEALEVPSWTTQSTWRFRIGLFMMQPFLQTFSFWISVLHTSHLYWILTKFISIINPQTFMMYLTMWSDGIDLIKWIESVGEKKSVRGP